MKIKVYSLLVSLVFIPVAILSQWIGLYIGKILYFIYDSVMSLRLPGFFSDILPAVVSGFIAAFVSALVVTKIYKDYNLLFATILPFVVILSAFLGDLLLANDVGWSTKSIGVIIREIVTISAYYYLLKEGLNLKRKEI